jgi:G:T/U-mismatch repair DNA glycosylase
MSVLKSVPDFLEDHIGSREVLVLGMNPSANKKPIKNGTFARLQSWMNSVGVPHWDFVNVVPHIIGDVKIEDVPFDVLNAWTAGRKAIICLGTFVGRVIKKAEVGDAKIILIDHPSPRNRNFNDPAYEPEMLERLKKELKDAGI